MTLRPFVRFAAGFGLLGALMMTPVPSVAQSLFGSGGLGVPVDAVGARARALANIGVGLRGPELHPLDPAAAADFVLPSVSATILSTSSTFTVGGAAGRASGQRFPVLGIVIPVRRYGNVTVGFNTLFDLRWGTRLTRTIDLGEAAGKVRVTDQFASDGGVSVFRLGWSRRYSEKVTVGLTGGPYLGNVIRSFARSFDSTAVGGVLEPSVEQGAWEFSGFTTTVGFGLDLGNSLHLAGSVTSSSGLDATPKGPTAGEAQTFDLPVEWRAGATVLLTPQLLAVGSLEVASYDDVLGGDDPVETRGRAVDWGGGIEWTQPSVGSLQTPVRIGYGRRELPFNLAEGPGEESFFTIGAGINFVVISGRPLAQLDFSVEKGSRTAPGLTEDFWRSGLTLRISGL